MDPLSVIVSSLALGAAARSALSVLLALQSHKEYHAWINALIIELEDFHLVIERCRVHLVRRRQEQALEEGGESDSPILSLAILRAHCVLKDLEEPLRGLLSGSVGKRRVKWAFGKERVTATRQSIRDAKLTLVLALAEAGMLDHCELRDRLDRIEASTEMLRHGILQAMASLLDEQALLRLDMRALSGRVGRLPGTDGSVIEGSGFDVTEGIAMSAMEEAGNVSTTSTLVESSRAVSTCIACCCKCHYRFRIDTPKWTSWLLGASLLAWSGPPWSSCSETQCKRQGRFQARLTYRFPSWLLPRMVNFSFSSLSPGGPSGLQFALRFPRVVPDNSDVLRLTAQGNQDGLQELFRQGIASPHDVGSSYGLTPLHIALFKRNFLLCEFLVSSAGADPFLNTGMRRCVIDIVREDLLRKHLTPEQSILLKRLFKTDDVDDLDSFNFTLLHKSVLGLSSIPLKDLLDTSTALIDAQDSQGRTALLWATSSRNASATKLLLDYGASPHVSTRTGQSPLHHAVEYGSHECARMLLAAGAKVNHQNRRGRTPLHYACRLDDEEGALMTRILIEAGADVNVRDRGGSTPLHETAHYARRAQMRILVEFGGDVSALNDDGRTPLDLGLDQALGSRDTEGEGNEDPSEDSDDSDLSLSMDENGQCTHTHSAHDMDIPEQDAHEHTILSTTTSTMTTSMSEGGISPCSSSVEPTPSIVLTIPPSHPQSCSHHRRRSSSSTTSGVETVSAGFRTGLGTGTTTTASVSTSHSPTSPVLTSTSFVYRHYEGLGDLARVSGNRSLLATRM